MPAIAPHELKKIIQKRVVLEEAVYVKVPLPNDAVLMLQVRWWEQFRTYQAVPVSKLEDRPYLVRLTMDDRWFRFIKRNLRVKYGVRHVSNINPKNNERRIEQLLGVQRV